jgi:cbb3-type cytochrome oxidase subunit 3
MGTWIYIGFTLLLIGVMIGMILYYFQGKRKRKVEEPKYRMLDDD